MGNIVLVGAGGTGMSGVAGMLCDLGFENIVCIDGTQSQLTDNLVEMGLNVVIGHGNYDVQLDDVVIYSAAADKSPEVQKAFSYSHDGKNLCIVRNYFQFLGEVSKYFSTIGITGTNGKSSTTFLGLCAAEELLPNFGIGILGALVSDFDEKNYLISVEHKIDIQNIFEAIFSKKELSDLSLIKKYVFMLEACEYKRHFLTLDLDHVVVTSLTCDHLDYFKDEDDYLSAFEELFAKVKEKIFMFEGDYESVVADVAVSEKTDGGEIVSLCSQSRQEQVVLVKKQKFAFDHIFGHWNSWNASLLAMLFELVYGVANKDFSAAIKGVSGLRRRMEFLGNLPGGAILYSDYGHMANPISMGYAALKEKYPEKNIVVCFQPHQLRRVVIERDVFISVLSKYDQIYIYDIYAARESLEDYQDFEGFQQIEDLTVENVGHFFAENCGGKYFVDFDIFWDDIKQLSEDSVLVIYSAGDIDYLIRQRIDE